MEFMSLWEKRGRNGEKPHCRLPDTQRKGWLIVESPIYHLTSRNSTLWVRQLGILIPFLPGRERGSGISALEQWFSKCGPWTSVSTTWERLEM